MTHVTKKAKFLWIDLEMTGLDPARDLILEVAAIATDKNFQELTTYESATNYSKRQVQARMSKNADFWHDNPETAQALLDQLVAGRSIKQIEQDLIHMAKEYFDPKYKIILAGNSVHMDQKFIARYLPRLNDLLHYRLLDVSAWKVVFEHNLHRKFSKPENHRALDDIRGSIEELKYYLGFIK